MSLNPTQANFYMESKNTKRKKLNPSSQSSKYGRRINSLHQIGSGGWAGGGCTLHYAQYNMPILLQQEGLTWTICVLLNLKPENCEMYMY